MIVQVSSDMAVEMWPTLAPLFKRVTDTTHGCYAPADILQEILNGKQLLWVAWDNEKLKVDAAMTTAIMNYPRRRTCKVIYISGDNMGEWSTEFMETVEKYAREQGATAMEGAHRRGWARVAGYQQDGYILFKELAA